MCMGERAKYSRKNFAQNQQILLGVSKYPGLQSSLSSPECLQSGGGGARTWLGLGKPLGSVGGGGYF